MVSEGDRVRLIHTDDPYTNLSRGDTGTVTDVTTDPPEVSPNNRPEPKVWVDWDDGGKMALVQSQDEFEVIDSDAQDQ